jgi:hypothetical protein
MFRAPGDNYLSDHLCRFSRRKVLFNWLIPIRQDQVVGVYKRRDLLVAAVLAPGFEVLLSIAVLRNSANACPSAADFIGVSRSSSLSAIGHQKLIYFFAFLPAPGNESVSTITKYR